MVHRKVQEVGGETGLPKVPRVVDTSERPLPPRPRLSLTDQIREAQHSYELLSLVDATVRDGGSSALSALAEKALQMYRGCILSGYNAIEVFSKIGKGADASCLVDVTAILLCDTYTTPLPRWRDIRPVAELIPEAIRLSGSDPTALRLRAAAQNHLDWMKLDKQHAQQQGQLRAMFGIAQPQ